jgi:hypothetical protein
MLKKERSTCLLPSSASVLCLLPNHWKMSEGQGHTQGHGGGGHGAHPGRVGAVDMMAALIGSSNTLGTLLF